MSLLQQQQILSTNSNFPSFSSLAWSDEDFPAAKKAEMLDIKASPGYMGNPQGEGAIWQRTPSGAEIKVDNFFENVYFPYWSGEH